MSCTKAAFEKKCHQSQKKKKYGSHTYEAAYLRDTLKRNNFFLFCSVKFFSVGRHSKNICIGRQSSSTRHWVLNTLYTSLVRPVLEYASIVWLPHQMSYINRLNRVQINFFLNEHKT